MEQSATSTEIIRYTIPGGQHEAFEKAYADAQAILSLSPYCRGYELICGVEEPDNYIVIIHWTSVEDHLNGFRKSAAFGPFFQLVKPFFSMIAEMKHYASTAVGWKP